MGLDLVLIMRASVDARMWNFVTGFVFGSHLGPLLEFLDCAERNSCGTVATDWTLLRPTLPLEHSDFAC
jgi:hypothetical protein